MNRRNYSRELEKLIEKNKGTMPRLLLHACCGICSSSVLEYLTQYFEITLLWYNPNLYPESEFDRRFAAQMQIISAMGLSDKVRVVALPWGKDEYYSRIAGFENEPEGGKRCTECFRLRLEKCAQLAAEGGYDYFCTTLTLSRHKDAVRINALGEEAALRYNVRWLPSDFKKRNGENRSQELAVMHGIYRQLYCGCEFSLRAREEGAVKAKTEETSAISASNNNT